MHRSITYRLLAKLTAFLLLMGVALPTGLHAKALVDFCLAPVEESSHMLPDHSCCPSETEGEHPESYDSTHNQCDSDLKCTCHIDEIPLNNQNWVTSNANYTGILTAFTTISSEDHTDNFHYPDFFSDTFSTPPIYLMNSTFLN